MQLNSGYFGHINWENPETNIRAGCRLIRELCERYEGQSYWVVAIAYNAGVGRVTRPPSSSIEYANTVMALYAELSKGYHNGIIQRNRQGKYQ